MNKFANIAIPILIIMQRASMSSKQIERALDRLQEFSDNSDFNAAIPAFYYSAEVLMKYAQFNGPDKVNHKYFENFHRLLQKFIARDFSAIKQHEKQIIDDIISITDSEIFIECLKQEMRTSRMIYLKEEGEEEEHDDRIETEPDSIISLKTSIIKQTSFEVQEILQKEKEKEISSFSIINDQAEQLFAELLTAYKQHRIDEAFELKELYLKKGFPLQDSQKDLFATIDLEYKTMVEFYKQFDMEGWIFDKEEKGVTLEYKLFEEEKQIAIRIQSEFNVNVQNFLAILTEMDLFGNYVPFCYDSKELKIVSRNQKIGTSKIYIPCLTDRETFFYAAGYDRFKTTGSVFCFSKTINEDALYQEKYGYQVPPKSDYVRLEYKFFIVEYIPLSKTRARVRLASKVDMKLNFLPQFILSMSARKFAFDYFKNIIKVNKKFEGSEWEKKVKQNPDFYEFFQSKIDDYLKDLK